MIFRFQLAAEESNLTLSLENEQPLNEIPSLWGNPDRVEQILVILLDNAIKYTPEEGKIVIKVRDQEQHLAIIVHNSGPVSKAKISIMYSTAFKADRAHAQPGTGLGLSIAKELAVHMGHDLDVHSEPGQGADFRLLIPYADTIMNSQQNLKEVFSCTPDDHELVINGIDEDIINPAGVSESEHSSDQAIISTETDTKDLSLSDTIKSLFKNKSSNDEQD